MKDREVESDFIQDVSALDHETEDGWRLSSHDIAPTPLLLQARTEPGVLESRGLVTGACYSIAIWPRGPLPRAGSAYRSDEPRHRAMVESRALPNIWYVKYDEAGIFGTRAQWKFLGRSCQDSEDPGTSRHRTFEKFHTRAGKGGVAEKFILRYVRGASLGTRMGGSMGGSWAWPLLPEHLRHP
ncbi:hypothetical protein [Streptomyces sp. NPDC018031]|uniref:hypothetical protein n=1 Tax=Streptomyces sp. NPDC018031 TaxID=3365033 RepID=UPI00378DBE8A